MKRNEWDSLNDLITLNKIGRITSIETELHDLYKTTEKEGNPPNSIETKEANETQETDSLREEKDSVRLEETNDIIEIELNSVYGANGHDGESLNSIREKESLFQSEELNSLYDKNGEEKSCCKRNGRTESTESESLEKERGIGRVRRTETVKTREIENLYAKIEREEYKYKMKETPEKMETFELEGLQNRKSDKIDEKVSTEAKEFNSLWEVSEQEEYYLDKPKTIVCITESIDRKEIESLHEEKYFDSTERTESFEAMNFARFQETFEEGEGSSEVGEIAASSEAINFARFHGTPEEEEGSLEGDETAASSEAMNFDRLRGTFGVEEGSSDEDEITESFEAMNLDRLRGTFEGEKVPSEKNEKILSFETTGKSVLMQMHNKEPQIIISKSTQITRNYIGAPNQSWSQILYVMPRMVTSVRIRIDNGEYGIQLLDESCKMITTKEERVIFLTIMTTILKYEGIGSYDRENNALPNCEQQIFKQQKDKQELNESDNQGRLSNSEMAKFINHEAPRPTIRYLYRPVHLLGTAITS